MKRIARYLLLAVLLWLLFLVLSMVIPPLVHKTAGPGDWEAEPPQPVSYTHLTLPTKA